MNGNRDGPFVIDGRGLTDVTMNNLSPAHGREPSSDQARRQRRDQPQFEAHRTEDIHNDGSDNPDDYGCCNGLSPASHSPSPISKMLRLVFRAVLAACLSKRRIRGLSFGGSMAVVYACALFVAGRSGFIVGFEGDPSWSRPVKESWATPSSPFVR